MNFFKKKKNKFRFKDLNVSDDIIKFLEDNPGKAFLNVFSDWFPKAKEIKAKIKKKKRENLIKLKSFCTAKETISKINYQLMEWEKILVNDITNERLISKIYKYLIQFNI